MARVYKCDICDREISTESWIGSNWLHLERTDCKEFGEECSGIDICNHCRSDISEYREFIDQGGLISSELQAAQIHTERVLRYILEGYIV